MHTNFKTKDGFNYSCVFVVNVVALSPADSQLLKYPAFSLNVR